MKIISWNCGGLGNSWEVLALLRLNRIENPNLVFLMETRLKGDEFQNIKRMSGFEGCLMVYCRGAEKERVGNLDLLWKEGILLSINSYCLNHIGGSVNDESDQHEWFFSGIYGNSEENNIRKIWILLLYLARRGGERFVCFRDLNDVLCKSEKLEGNSRTQGQFSLGRHIMEPCGLIDLGFEGEIRWQN
ncbi:unnamed protein product [Vicia faba]|uniref:Uncharacterized protein n=1 Tax=Vicia faba TaxID=3906 RepID=A0AAV1A986_VICFA|nr:unnamed protein product [Vicia faba]